jgi:hypothetical protein
MQNVSRVPAIRLLVLGMLVFVATLGAQDRQGLLRRERQDGQTD